MLKNLREKIFEKFNKTLNNRVFAYQDKISAEFENKRKLLLKEIESKRAKILSEQRLYKKNDKSHIKLEHLKKFEQESLESLEIEEFDSLDFTTPEVSRGTRSKEKAKFLKFIRSGFFSLFKFFIIESYHYWDKQLEIDVDYFSAFIDDLKYRIFEERWTIFSFIKVIIGWCLLIIPFYFLGRLLIYIIFLILRLLFYFLNNSIELFLIVKFNKRPTLLQPFYILIYFLHKNILVNLRWLLIDRLYLDLPIYVLEWYHYIFSIEFAEDIFGYFLMKIENFLYGTFFFVRRIFFFFNLRIRFKLGRYRRILRYYSYRISSLPYRILRFPFRLPRLLLNYIKKTIRKIIYNIKRIIYNIKRIIYYIRKITRKTIYYIRKITRKIIYNIKKITYNIKKIIRKITYNIKKIIRKITYNIRKIIRKIIYNIRKTIYYIKKTIRKIIYYIRKTIKKIIYNIRKTIRKIIYNIRKTIYNIKKTIKKIIYNIRKTIKKIIYNIRKTIKKIIYNIRKTIYNIKNFLSLNLSKIKLVVIRIKHKMSLKKLYLKACFFFLLSYKNVLLNTSIYIYITKKKNLKLRVEYFFEQLTYEKKHAFFKNPINFIIYYFIYKLLLCINKFTIIFYNLRISNLILKDKILTLKLFIDSYIWNNLRYFNVFSKSTYNRFYELILLNINIFFNFLKRFYFFTKNTKAFFFIIINCHKIRFKNAFILFYVANMYNLKMKLYMFGYLSDILESLNINLRKWAFFVNINLRRNKSFNIFFFIIFKFILILRRTFIIIFENIFKISNKLLFILKPFLFSLKWCCWVVLFIYNIFIFLIKRMLFIFSYFVWCVKLICWKIKCHFVKLCKFFDGEVSYIFPFFSKMLRLFLYALSFITTSIINLLIWILFIIKLPIVCIGFIIKFIKKLFIIIKKLFIIIKKLFIIITRNIYSIFYRLPIIIENFFIMLNMDNKNFFYIIKSFLSTKFYILYLKANREILKYRIKFYFFYLTHIYYKIKILINFIILKICRFFIWEASCELKIMAYIYLFFLYILFALLSVSWVFLYFVYLIILWVYYFFVGILFLISCVLFLPYKLIIKIYKLNKKPQKKDRKY